jgi:Ni,Fe-hydrogenase III small subunit/NAD-dependent dihydropyrimidine dehydrogenase PreA subunit
MLRLLGYLVNRGVVTEKIPQQLPEGVTGFPRVSPDSCISAEGCSDCSSICPTEAITLAAKSVQIDRGACINCNLCVSICASSAITNDNSTKTFAFKREDLLLPAGSAMAVEPPQDSPFMRSLNVRVVSTGCAACDLELSAAGNPVFDMERFGIKIVASPRFADALLVTGPVPRAMQTALKSCYNGMPGPKVVIACGTCAISGGIHKHGYTEANGVDSVLPVDVYIPGCPPHPWHLIRGLRAAAERLALKAQNRP